MVTFTGKAKTKYEKALVKASESCDYVLRFETTRLDYSEDHSSENVTAQILGGAFMGANTNTNTDMLEVNYKVNAGVLESLENLFKGNKHYNSSLGHEFIEGFIIAETMISANIKSTGISTDKNENPLYLNAHNQTRKYGVGQVDFGFFDSLHGKGYYHFYHQNKKKTINTKTGRIY